MLKTIIAVACAGCVIATGAVAQEFPSKNVTLMMPYAAGGPGDMITRVIGNGMSKVLGRQFLVENVAGAGGTTDADRARGAGHILDQQRLAERGPHGLDQLAGQRIDRAAGAVPL